MKVYLLEEHERYEGQALLGIYSYQMAAEVEAAKRRSELDKRRTDVSYHVTEQEVIE